MVSEKLIKSFLNKIVHVEYINNRNVLAYEDGTLTGFNSDEDNKILDVEIETENTFKKIDVEQIRTLFGK